jgi:hypothetical protein
MTSKGNGDRRPLVIGYDGSEFAKHAIQEAARLFPGRRAVVVNVFPSAADTAAAAAIGVPEGVLRVAVERLHEASRQAAEVRASEGALLSREAGLAAEERSEATEGSNWSALSRIGDEEALAVVVKSRGFRGSSRWWAGAPHPASFITPPAPWSSCRRRRSQLDVGRGRARPFAGACALRPDQAAVWPADALRDRPRDSGAVAHPGRRIAQD